MPVFSTMSEKSTISPAGVVLRGVDFSTSTWNVPGLRVNVRLAVAVATGSEGCVEVPLTSLTTLDGKATLPLPSSKVVRTRATNTIDVLHDAAGAVTENRESSALR